MRQKYHDFDLTSFSIRRTKCSNPTIMKKKIEKFSLNTLGNGISEHGKQAYVSEKLFMTISSRQFGMKFLQKGQTYRVDEGRIMRILSGKATCFINLKPYALLSQMLLFIPAGTIFEIEDYDEDFDLQAFTLTDLPQSASFDTCTEFHLSGEDWLLTGDYFRLLWSELSHAVLSLNSVSSLQAALLARLHLFHDKEEMNHGHASARKDDRFIRFLALLNEYGICERNISFYAEHLCVTPNHLGFIIKQASGLTVMQWINRYIIQQAKIQLKYSDLPIWEIAELLNFPTSGFFSTFFKKETGISPGEYRKV